jgi:aspartate-semialdehyde dehydrogenase
MHEMEFQNKALSGRNDLYAVGNHTAKREDIVKFKHQIAFNLIPQIDVFTENFYTKEEMKMVHETRKIMEIPRLKLTATCVRVPVFYSHSECVNVETKEKISREEVIRILKKFGGVTVVEDTANCQYPMPLQAEGKDDVFVGRIREDESVKNGLNMWVVSDNIRKGAALNAVQIAEKLIG